MRVSEALARVRRVFLDSAPIIYFVEGNREYDARTSPFFQAMARGTIIGVTSTISLAECLVYPYRLKNAELVRDFHAVITEGRNTIHVGVDDHCEEAAELRARYNLSLGDALQLAAARAAGCDSFLTNDAQLKRVQELQVLLLSEMTLDDQPEQR